MSQSGIDQNQVKTALAVDTNGVTQPLRCDPSTGRLLVEVTIVSSTSPATLPATLPRDQNRIPVAGGVTDDASQTITPLIVDSRNGYLFVDIG